MDERSKRAYEILDRREAKKAEHAAWLAQHEIEILNCETDTLLAELEQRRRQPKGDGLVRKDYGQPDAPTSWPQPQPATMDAASSTEWNAWAQAVARREATAVCEALAEIAGECTGKLQRKQENEYAELFAKIDRLQSVVVQLESRIAALEANNGYAG